MGRFLLVSRFCADSCLLSFQPRAVAVVIVSDPDCFCCSCSSSSSGFRFVGGPVAPFPPCLFGPPTVFLRWLRFRIVCLLLSLFPDRGWPFYSVPDLDCVFCVCFLVRNSPHFPCSRIGVLAALTHVVVWAVLVCLGPCLLRRLLVWGVLLCTDCCSGLSPDLSPDVRPLSYRFTLCVGVSGCCDGVF